MRWLFLLAVVAGCYDSSGVQCGTLLCPHGDVCAPMEDRCVAPEQVSSCDGLAEGAGCVAGAITDGLCHLGVCIEAGCGNGVIEPGERCDDGNRISLDGCSSDCHSDERCGNGLVDLALGEQCDCGDSSGTVTAPGTANCSGPNSDDPGATCRTGCQLARCGDGVLDPGEWCDDGNTNAGDGCRADCQGRFTVMASGTLKNLASVWGSSATDVYAAGDSRLLHFDGLHWTQMQPPNLNILNAGVCATSLGLFVLTKQNGFGDIWKWNGTMWTHVSPGPHNPTAMTCANDEVVAAATANGAAFVEFYNGTWTQTSSLAQGSGITSVFARSRSDIYAWVANGGFALHHWNGTSWTQLPTPPGGANAVVTGTPNGDVFAGPPLYRIQGSTSTLQVEADEITVTGIAGVDNDVLLVGTAPPVGAGAAMQFDGMHWTLLPMPTGLAKLSSAWVYAPGRAFIVGDYGTILY